MPAGQLNPIRWVIPSSAYHREACYTARLISTLLGRHANIVETGDTDASDLPTLVYGDVSTPGELRLSPEVDFWAMVPQGGDVTPTDSRHWRDCLFPCWRQPASESCPVDPLAAVFFCLSRIEERGARQSDEHSRFRATDAWQTRNGLIERLIVHEYATAIGGALGLDANPTPSPWPAGRRCAIALTHDIDRLRMHASSFQNRGADVQDPYDRVGWLIERHRKLDSKATFFWIATVPSPRDADYAIDSHAVIDDLQMILEAGHEVGLHGSYDSYLSGDLLKEQRLALTEAAGCQIHSTRQHYLRFSATETWEAQSQAGLTVDSTLGFSGRAGFRAGLALPYRPWDFRRRKPYDLWEVPLAIMDGTLKEYMNLKPERAMEKSRTLIRRVSESGGAASLLWHNSALNEIDWKGWTPVYESWLDELQSKNAWCATLSQIADAWAAHVRALGNDEESL